MIEHFLWCTARWTPQWFNKPKFHILRHLPAHIRRFGPAILFATEGFESFNAVVRSKSVHSNRHTPSRDIANTFGHANRICHLLSGGVFMPKGPGQHRATGSHQPFSNDCNDWVCAGRYPLALTSPWAHIKNMVADYYGLQTNNNTDAPMPGMYHCLSHLVTELNSPCI